MFNDTSRSRCTAASRGLPVASFARIFLRGFAEPKAQLGSVDSAQHANGRLPTAAPQDRVSSGVMAPRRPKKTTTATDVAD